MAKKVSNLVDEGFRIDLVVDAFFDGCFEIPLTTYFIPFATDLKYVSSACCIIQSSKQTKRINRRIIKISGGYKNDKGN